MKIRLIEEKYIPFVVDLIDKTCNNEKFLSFYPQSEVDAITSSLNYEGVKKRASWTHFYVVEVNDKIVGCGAIGPYWDSKIESSLFTIFVDPDLQRGGIGRKIIETLENDEFFKRAKRIEIPASMLALPFYKKMGYTHKNGVLNYSEGHFAVEKFNDKNL